ncbi:MAG: hypothetical protein ACRDIV_03885 [Ktedonobacteraceae bacterium]
MQPYGDNFILVIPVDFLLHEPDRPFCYDMSCSCKTDERLLWEVSRFIEEGLMTLEEGQTFVAGRTV